MFNENQISPENEIEKNYQAEERITLGSTETQFSDFKKTKIDSIELKKNPDKTKEDILDVLAQVVRKDPSPILRNEIADFIKEDHDPKETYAFYRKIPDYNVTRNREIQRWQQNDLIKKIMENGQEIIIADVDKIANSPARFFKKGARKKIEEPLYQSPYYGDSNFLKSLDYLFPKGIISKEDYVEAKQNNEPIKTKPLFYAPKTEDAAFDPEQIKKAQFYKGFWHLRTIPSLPHTPQLDSKEVALACLIFHPQYGNGRYNERNQLELYNQKENKYRPFSFNYLTEQFGFQLGTSIIDFAETHCKNLIKKRLLKPENFTTYSATAEKKDIFNLKKPDTRGMVMIDGIFYILGRDKKFQNALAGRINEKYGCVVNQENNIQYIFNIYKKDAPQVRGKYNIVNQASVGLQTLENFQKRTDGENDFDYSKRIETVNNFQFELKFSQLLRGLNPPIEYNFLTKEDKNLLIGNKEKIQELDQKTFKRYLENFREKGLVALANCEALSKTGSTLISTCENFSQREDADKLMEYINTEIAPNYQYCANHILPEIFKENNSNFDSGQYSKEIGYELSQYIRIMQKETETNPDITFDNINNKLPIIRKTMSQQSIVASLFENTAVYLANNFSAEKSKDFLDSAMKKGNNPQKKQIINNILKYLNTEAPETVFHDLRELYKNIKFEEYEVNQKMQHHEKELIEKEFLGKPQKCGNVLDLGCGTGRMLIPLNEEGYKIDGVDYSKRHVDYIKEHHPEIDVTEGDWTNLTNIEANSYENVLSLGRSILHEYQKFRQIKLFEEVNRILAPGGKFIFDIPNNQKGQYKKLIDMYADKMHERKIENFVHNTIYDSPDGKSFFTRYAYSHEDILELAEKAGFRIMRAIRKPLENSHGDENIYYELEKVAQSDALIKPYELTVAA